MSTPPEPVTRQNSQTLHITTRVADIQFTGMVASTEQCDSSDEDVVEALSLRNPHDTCKIISLSYIKKNYRNRLTKQMTQFSVVFYTMNHIVRNFLPERHKVKNINKNKLLITQAC